MLFPMATQSIRGLSMSIIAEAFGPGFPNAIVGVFVFQNLIGIVGEDDRGDIKALSRLRPKRLDGVHGASVTHHAEHAAIGASRCTGRDRGSESNRSPHILQDIVRPRARG